jgi:hypothetical protein
MDLSNTHSDARDTPEDPVLVSSTWYQPSATDTPEIHVTRLKLETSENLIAAHFVLLDSAS